MDKTERMISESPDRWIVIKIDNNGEAIYKVFATWYGGYLGADRWKMNSGIAKVEEDDNSFYFYGHSGSCYQCPKSENCYGTSGYSQGVLDSIMGRVPHGYEIGVLEHDTDWLNLIK